MEIYEDDDRRLDAAVSLGIITAAQAAQIRALTPARAPLRLPRALGGSVLAYALGAITVLIAMGWFLADRWDYLGAGGVLAVVTVYGALFVLVAWRMRREGFQVAEGVAALLAVALVPLAVIALNDLLDWLPEPNASGCGRSYGPSPLFFDFWVCRGLEVTIELAVLAAALIAWRITRFSIFALVVGAVGMRFVFHLVAAATGGQSQGSAAGWTWVICASLMVASAYVADRQREDARDIGLWLHALAAVAAATASAMLLNQFDGFRQLLLPAAFVAFAFSLRMRRAGWTLLGLAWFVAYLGWLAAEVFRDTPVFPIVLAALGIGVIVATVWVQRNRERLAARFGGLDSEGQPSFPGGVALLLLPALVAALQLPGAVELDQAIRRDQQAQTTAARRIFERERRERAADTLPVPGQAPDRESTAGPARGAVRETAPVRRP